MSDKLNWEAVPRDEQESILNINYSEKTLTFYTSRKSVADRLKKKVGEPTNIDSNNNLISGVTYIRNLHDKDIKQFLSISTIIGGFRSDYVANDKLVKED